MKSKRLWITIAIAAVAVLGIAAGIVALVISNTTYEVTFALEDETTEQEAAATVLPETVRVPRGTTVGSLSSATRDSCMFMNWTYDGANQSHAQDEDVIDKDITLYPYFVEQTNMSDSKGFTYVSKTDVAEDFRIGLISYSLTEEEIRDVLSVKNSSMADTEEEYTLISVRERESKEWLSSIGLNEATCNAVWETMAAYEAQVRISQTTEEDTIESIAAKAEKAESGEEVTEEISFPDMLKALAEGKAGIELTQDNIDEIITHFYGSDDEEDYGVSLSNYDDTMVNVFKALNIDFSIVTEDDLRIRYGLDEDDSVERFWREDVGLDVDQINVLEELLYAPKEIKGEEWELIPASGSWEGGYVYSAEISDTSSLRYMYDGEPTAEEVTEYNITVHLEEVENISVDSRVKHLMASEVTGVEFRGMLSVEADENGQISAEENTGSGTMTYTGDEEILKGDTVAVHKGEYDENGLTDAEVAYVTITDVLGEGQYSYDYAAVENVLFIADVIPVPDDGSIDDGSITLSDEILDFTDAKYDEYELGATTVVEEGDYLTFYTGTLGGDDFDTVGHGIITEVKEGNGARTISYDMVSEEEFSAPEVLLYAKLPEVEIDVTEHDNEELREQMEQQVAESGLVDETRDMFVALLTGEEIDFDSLENGEELRNLTIKTDGKDLTLDELRQLSSGGGKVEVSDFQVTFLAGIKLQHFEGKTGLRGEFTVSFTISIKIGDAGSLEIEPMLVFEQEFMLTPEVKVKRNKRASGLTSSLDITASLSAGTYTGFGVTVTAQTKAADDGEDSDFATMVGGFIDNGNGADLEKRKSVAKGLITAGEGLKAMSLFDEEAGKGTGIDNSGGETNTGEESRQDMKSNGIGGDLPTKYANMLSNDADYINIVDIDLGSFDMPVDPAGVIHIGMKINLTVGLKINAMIGAGLTYENAKCYAYSFRQKIWGGGKEYEEGAVNQMKTGSSVTDIAKSRFRADFYAFGMIGLRAGVAIDLRVGLFSTDLDSVGVVASAGVYAELYGFLYVYYEKTAGEPSKSGASGSLMFEVGLFNDISVQVQVGGGWASKEWSLYSTETPLWIAGCENFPLDFAISQSDPKLSVEIPDGDNTVKIDSSIFDMNLMALKDGETSTENMDSKLVNKTGAVKYTAQIKTGATVDDEGNVNYDGKEATVIMSTERSWTQYNEENFTVQCFDLTGKNGEVIEGASSFQYLPGTNEITICPVDSTKDEVYGKVVFTYINDAFGFNTEKFQRTVYVHWKGTHATSQVEIYLQSNREEDESYTYELYANGAVSGFDGIRFYIDITPEYCAKYTGYELWHLGFPDEDELREKYDNLTELVKKQELHRDSLCRQAAVARLNGSSIPQTQLDQEANEAIAEYNRLYEEWCIAYNLYWEYLHNNEDAVYNKSGRTYFTMRGNNTVIRMYYKKIETPSAWMIIDPETGDRILEAEWTYVQRFEPRYNHTRLALDWDYTRMMVGLNVLDFVPEQLEGYKAEDYDTTWYLYQYQRTRYGPLFPDFALLEGVTDITKRVKSGDYSELVEVTPDTVVPDQHCIVVGLLTGKDVDVQWMDGDDVLYTTTAKYKGTVTIPTEVPVKDGYTFVKWTTENGDDVTDSTIVESKNMKLYAQYEGYDHTVTYVTEDDKTASVKVKTGESIYMAVPEDLGKSGYTQVWRTDEADAESEIDTGYKMPNHDITVYGRYSLGFSNITWIDGTTTVGTDSVEIGTAPSAPQLAARYDKATGSALDLVWMIGEDVMQYNYVMTDEDITATANWHQHVWSEEEVTLDATCAAVGVTGKVCTVCGYVSPDTIIPVDPDNHNWSVLETQPATCIATGTERSSCMWCGADKTEVLDIDPDNHVHTEIHDYVQAGCGSEGYTGDLFCTDCQKIVEEGEVIPATGNHTRSKDYTIVSGTCSTEGALVYTCTVCGEKIYHYIGTVSWRHMNLVEGKVIKEANCSEDGQQEYTCADCGAVVIEAIPATGRHTTTPGEIIQAGTCTTKTKYRSVCIYCGMEYTWTTTLDSNNHTGLGEKELVTEATCNSAGQYRTYCSACGKYVYEDIEPLGHDYSDITYEWSDNNHNVTAVARCTRCGDELTETVRTDVEEVKAPTCTESGQMTYTTQDFTVYPEYFTQQVKTVDTEATGHAWGEAVYTWSDDYSEATATRTCSNDASHTETETVKTTSSVTKEPTIYTKGETTYTAEFTNSAFEKQTVTVDDIDSLDADWTAVEYVWSDDYSSVTATRTSRTDSTVTETETSATVTSEITKEATCEEDGEIVYTATFENEDLNVQQSVVIEALGHDWELQTTKYPEPVIETVDGFDACTGWNTGYNRYVCKRDANHTYDETIKVSTAITTYEEDTITIDGNNITINLINPLIMNECMAEEFYTEDMGMSTVGDIISAWLYAVPYSEPYAGWYTMDYEDFELQGALMQYQYDGDLVYEDSSQKDVNILDYTEDQLEVKLSFVPDDTDTFESVEDVTVTIIWPDYSDHEHVWSDWTVETAATCTESGVETRQCSICGEKESRDIKALGHNFCGEVVNDVASTCSTHGYKETRCIRCDATQKEQYELDPDNHSNIVTDEAVEATCTETGLTEGSHCEGCGKVIIAQQTTEALGHNYESFVTAPSCTEEGYTIHVCSRCNDSYTDTYVPAVGHDWGEWETTLEPTCTDPGERTRYCNNCGEGEFEEIPATGHNMTEYAATEATCTEAGNSLYYKCENCGLYFADSEGNEELAEGGWIIEALGHNLTPHAAVAATCTTNGNDEYYSCDRCGKYFADADGTEAIEEGSWVIEAPGHNLTPHAAVAATCEEDGNSEYYSCDRCGKYFADADGTEAIEEGSWVIEALGHNLTPHAAVAATCTTNGNDEYYSCDRCGKYFADADGTTEIEEGEWVTLAEGHVLTTHEAVAATCTTSGNSKYYSCDVCGKYFADANGTEEIEEGSWVIEKLGHNMTPHAAVEATCTDSGNSLYYSCDRCGRYFSDANGTEEIEEGSWVIEKLGHNMTPHAAVAATCEEDGNSEYYSCDRCGRYFADADGTEEIEEGSWVIEKLGHNWELTDSKEPGPVYGTDEYGNTCVTGWEAGYNKYTCQNNGEHQYTDTVKVKIGIMNCVDEWATQDGNNITFDLTAPLISDKLTAVEMYSDEMISTIGGIISSWVMAQPYTDSEEFSGWYLNYGEANPDLYTLLYGFAFEDISKIVYKDKSQAEISILECEEEEIQVILSVDPDDKKTYETLEEFTITIILPKEEIKLGNEYTDGSGNPVISLDLLASLMSEEPLASSETVYLGDQFTPSDLFFGAYVGDGYGDEGSVTLTEAELTWAEDYSTVNVSEICDGDVFYIRADCDGYASVIFEVKAYLEQAMVGTSGTSSRIMSGSKDRCSVK